MNALLQPSTSYIRSSTFLDKEIGKRFRDEIYKSKCYVDKNGSMLSITIRCMI